LLGPSEFLPAAERAGLLAALTEHVLDAALAQVRRFLDRGMEIPVSVNITAPDLLDLTFVRRVGRALDSHEVPAELLCLEVTETVVMSDPDRIVAALGGLRALGVGLSLDDYGTGLSSLAYLQTLPVDELKIDRSFVSRLVHDRGSALIVGSTIGLAHGLALRVVAEGVEDEATMQVLASVGCDTVQGFLLGRPVPADELDLASVPSRPITEAIPWPRPGLIAGAAAAGSAVMTGPEFKPGARGGDRSW
jgi:EAL domain-containing protein (putative c-di-GMP-specific phosphodiesterase class I)